MGSGKSSVAEMLARTRGCAKIETDELVLQQSGRNSIADIFFHDGEIAFRELEIQVAKMCGDRVNTVISTGGGMIMNKICIDYMRRNAKVVFLATSFAVIKQRLAHDTTRPLFADIKAAKTLFTLRQGLYRAYADMTVMTDGRSVSEISEIILHTI